MRNNYEGKKMILEPPKIEEGQRIIEISKPKAAPEKKSVFEKVAGAMKEMGKAVKEVFTGRKKSEEEVKEKKPTILEKTTEVTKTAAQKTAEGAMAVGQATKEVASKVATAAKQGVQEGMKSAE